MDWYGLGIALQFRDNATSGITRATQNLTNLSTSARNMASTTTQALSDVEKRMRTFETIQMSGYFVQNIGDSIASVGKSMLDPLISVASQVTSTGAQFENYRLTLKALYGDAEVAIAKTNEAMQLAANTPFQIGDVMNSVIGFKAIGVEALDTMEHLTGESRTLLEYIGDLASLRPDIGLDGMLMGIRNLLGGDGGRSLRSRLDMDFEQMLGFEWADTTEGIIEQIVYASQQVANGLMKEMEGSWQHMTSNIEDQWDRFKLAISDAGFFDGVKGTLRYFYEMVDSIDEDKMARIGKNISGAFNMIWKPIDFVARKLTDFFGFIVNLVETNPLIAKFVTGFISLAGALTVVSGTVIALGGAFLILIGGLNLFAMQIRLLPSTLATLVGGLKSALLFMGKFALIGGTLYALWKTDFAGIRTILSNFMQNVYTAFKKSSEIASMGATEMINSLEALDTTTFGGWLTYQLVRLQVLWMALVECWNTNELSDETFKKVQYLGLLPLISFILDCKARFEAFVKGFLEGWQTVSDFVKPILEWIGEKLFDIANFFFPIEEGTKNMNTEFGHIDLTKWEQLGKLVGVFSFGLLLAMPLFKVAQFVYNLVTGIIGFISTVAGVISTIWGWITGFIGFLATITGLSTGWVIAILVAVGLLVAGIIKYKDEIWATLQSLIEFVGSLFVGAFQTAFELVVGICDTAIRSVEDIVNGLFDILGGIIDFVVGIFTGNWKQAWEGVKSIFKGVFDSLVGIVKTPLNAIIDCINAVIGGLNKINFNVPDWVPGLGGKSFGVNISKIPKLNTGGFIKDEGISMLHPNEVVINDVLTQKLRNFLDGQEQKPESYETKKQEPSYYYNSGVDTNNVQGRATNNISNDNSVTFNQGAIVIQYSATGNGSDSDARELAQQVMKYIQKETKLRKSLNYAK